MCLPPSALSAGIERFLRDFEMNMHGLGRRTVVFRLFFAVVFRRIFLPEKNRKSIDTIGVVCYDSSKLVVANLQEERVQMTNQMEDGSPGVVAVLSQEMSGGAASIFFHYELAVAN